MSTSLTVAAPNWDDPKLLETIKETVCKGATPAQFRMFLEVCRGTGLNPFLKEIYFVPSVGVMAARDGYLRVANQHPQFDGMETRVERDEKNIPIKAVCTVWRKDRGHPIIAEAYYNEYRKPGNVWATYPSAMIAKVAEVLALKRSFAINGVVTEEEIGEREPQGSKEAQREYLASKGIGAPMPVAIDLMPAESGSEASLVAGRNPVVVPHRGDAGANQPAGSPTSAQTIRELADTLDQPPQISDIERRQAIKDAEAQAAIKPIDGKKRKRGSISFDALKSWRKLKDELRALTGTDQIYYSTLKSKGFDHADEIDSESTARAIFGVLGVERKRLMERDDNLKTLSAASDVIGARAFANCLGTHGAETLEDALGLAGDAWQALLGELKDLVDARKASSV